MVVIVARLEAVDGKAEEVERELRGLTEYVRNEEPATITYLFHRAKGQPQRFLFYERYMDEDALAKHSSSIRFQQVFQRINPLLVGPPEVEMYEIIAGK